MTHKRKSPLPDASVLASRAPRNRPLLTQHPVRPPAENTYRRHPDYIYRRRRIAAAGVVVVLVWMIVLCAGIFGPKSSVSVNGDQLGPDSDESLMDYHARALETLAHVKTETYALVTFANPVSSESAARLVAPAHRVSALITSQDLVPVALPEPVGAATRADVFAQHAAHSRINSVVVWDNADALEAIANTPGVWAVEAAPPGAAWGGIAIRPVIRDSSAAGGGAAG